MQKVVIGIQARSDSSRFPGKIYADILGKTMCGHVIDACHRASDMINRWGRRSGVACEIVLLIPEGDKAKEVYGNQVTIFEGPKENVLSRYYQMATAFKADYVVRITSDCPMLPPDMIRNHVIIAHKDSYDYISNVDENIRVSADGFDCEVLSFKALAWLNGACTDPAEQEHVTLKIRKDYPEVLKIGWMVGHLDISGMKLSVDTEEDLEQVRRHMTRIQQATQWIKSKRGQIHCHRFA